MCAHTNKMSLSTDSLCVEVASPCPHPPHAMIRTHHVFSPPKVASHNKIAAPTIAFSVVELTGKELPMTMLSALHTVAELKQAVAAASGMRAAQVRLVLKNEVLDDESKTLGEHGVEAGSQVHAVAGALG